MGELTVERTRGVEYTENGGRGFHLHGATAGLYAVAATILTWWWRSRCVRGSRWVFGRPRSTCFLAVYLFPSSSRDPALRVFPGSGCAVAFGCPGLYLPDAAGLGLHAEEILRDDTSQRRIGGSDGAGRLGIIRGSESRGRASIMAVDLYDFMIAWNESSSPCCSWENTNGGRCRWGWRNRDACRYRSGADGRFGVLTLPS